MSDDKRKNADADTGRNDRPKPGSTGQSGDDRTTRTDDPKSRGLPLGGAKDDVDAEGGSRSGSAPSVPLSD